MQQKKHNSKYLTTPEDFEEAKKEAISEIIRIDKELKEENRKKKNKIILIIVIGLILFKIFIGEIVINSPNLIDQHKNRLYQVKLNNEIMTVGVEEAETKTIIPFLITLRHISSHVFFGKDTMKLNYNLGDKIDLDIKSFECYSKDDFQLSCVPDNGNLLKKEKNDLKFHMHIKKATKGEKVFYDGELINNISDYLTEKGLYHISIVAKYKNVESTIYFNLKIG